LIVPEGTPAQFAEPSDAAKRCSDAVTLAVIAGAAGHFLAISLQTGKDDRALYPTREDAIRHQLRPQDCTYVRVPPDGMNPFEAEALLDYWRKLRDRNVHDGDLDVPMPLMPLTKRDRGRQIRLLTAKR
jgi:hypothetical protein